MRTVLIRADGGDGLGNGHLSRCFSLAEDLRSRGVEVVLLTAVEVDVLAWWRGAGIPVEVHGLAPSSAEDLARTREAAARSDWVVIDGYHFDPEFEARCHTGGTRLLRFDDLGQLPTRADIVLNANVGADIRFAKSYPNAGMALLGPRYALLRERMRAQRQAVWSEPRRDVLVNYGGADPLGLARVTWRELARTMPDRRVTLITVSDGSDFPSAVHDFEALPPTDLATLLPDTRLLICAGGITALEAAFLGVPAVIVTSAENQIPGVESLARSGAVLHAGHGAQAVADAAAMAVTLLGDDDARAAMSAAGRTLVDGEGARRVYDAMTSASFGFKH